MGCGIYTIEGALHVLVINLDKQKCFSLKNKFNRVKFQGRVTLLRRRKSVLKRGNETVTKKLPLDTFSAQLIVRDWNSN